MSLFAKWDHLHPSPLPSEGEGTGRPALAASSDGFRLSAAGMAWEKGVEGSRLGGGCAFRRDGFLPPQE